MNFLLHSPAIFVLQEITQCHQCDFRYIRVWSGTGHIGAGLYAFRVQRFQDLVSNLFTAFDPELKIVPATGKVFDGQDKAIAAIRKMPEVALVSESLEDNALVQYQGRQAMAVIKGVEDNLKN